MKLQATRGLLHEGRPIRPGTVFDAEPAAAAALLDAGRVELVRADDAAAVDAARQAAIRAALREAGRPWQPPEYGTGWMPARLN